MELTPNTSRPIITLSTRESRATQGEMDMITMMAQEYASSQPVYTETSISHAHNMGKNGGFYKVQIIGEFGEIIAEYK